jgi:hypothetical protein
MEEPGAVDAAQAVVLVSFDLNQKILQLLKILEHATTVRRLKFFPTHPSQLSQGSRHQQWVGIIFQMQPIFQHFPDLLRTNPPPLFKGFWKSAAFFPVVFLVCTFFLLVWEGAFGVAPDVLSTKDPVKEAILSNFPADMDGLRENLQFFFTPFRIPGHRFSCTVCKMALSTCQEP